MRKALLAAVRALSIGARDNPFNIDRAIEGLGTLPWPFEESITIPDTLLFSVFDKLPNGPPQISPLQLIAALLRNGGWERKELLQATLDACHYADNASRREELIEVVCEYEGVVNEAFKQTAAGKLEAVQNLLGEMDEDRKLSVLAGLCTEFDWSLLLGMVPEDKLLEYVDENDLVDDLLENQDIEASGTVTISINGNTVAELEL